jgi:sugar/nucleoside kinase (ribokinase family)
MLAHYGEEVYPQAQFDCSPQGQQIKADLERYGCDTRFVENIPTGGTAILECSHRLDKNTGEHKIAFRSYGPESRFIRRKQLRVKDEVPAFLEALAFVPDLYFFDSPEAGPRALAAALAAKGSLVYFESEGDRGNADNRRKMLRGFEVSHIIKCSSSNVSAEDLQGYEQGRLLILTDAEKGVRFNLNGAGWVSLPAVPNDNVVDWEGAGDWTTATFIHQLSLQGVRQMRDITPELVTRCLNEAQKVASRSVSYIGSKGMIRESHVRF